MDLKNLFLRKAIVNKHHVPHALIVAAVLLHLQGTHLPYSQCHGHTFMEWKIKKNATRHWSVLSLNGASVLTSHRMIDGFDVWKLEFKVGNKRTQCLKRGKTV